MMPSKHLSIKLIEYLAARQHILLLASSKFDVDCGLVSVIGDDFEESDLENFTRLRCRYLMELNRVQDGKSFFWSGRYHDNMNSEQL